MTNLEALKGMCNVICNTFYPDDSSLKTILFNDGVNSCDSAVPKNPKIAKLAIEMVLGFVESSRSENGVSTSNFEKSITRNIKHWCEVYGFNPSEYVEVSTIENGSNLW